MSAVEQMPSYFRSEPMVSWFLCQGKHFKNSNSSELAVDDFSIYVHVNQHLKKIIIFPLYRYGIRAPVYLRNKDGQVLYVQESGQSEWTGGSITKSEGSVSVNSLVGSMTLTLLDHITVSRIITPENGYFFHTCRLIDSPEF